jgi:hypothetical protein
VVSVSDALVGIMMVEETATVRYPDDSKPNSTSILDPAKSSQGALSYRLLYNDELNIHLKPYNQLKNATSRVEYCRAQFRCMYNYVLKYIKDAGFEFREAIDDDDDSRSIDDTIDGDDDAAMQ